MSVNTVEITGINTNSLKVLKDSEIKRLFLEYKSGNMQAKNDLVEGNLKLVLSIIKKYNNSKNDLNDLFQIGCVGLIKAIDNFDINVGVMFSTYAVPLIKGEVKRYIRDNSSLRVSRSIKDLAYHIMLFKDEFYRINGYEATLNDILNEFNISEYEYYEAINANIKPMSIYDPIYNDGGDTIYLMDQISDNNLNDLNKDDLISLKNALLKIKKVEKDIITKRYLIGKTQVELADEMGVSQAQISRIEKSALNNLKNLIR